ncbi:hypothetical protein CRUP_032329 [Coryphaenoides rupestris]|nr:hypothetical protein CRUP_032329 [Coryphaenoides rupestris]
MAASERASTRPGPGEETVPRSARLRGAQRAPVFRLQSSCALVGSRATNKYEVRNTLGQNVFYAVEENDCLSRQCCGPLRSFTIRVLDNYGHEIITLEVQAPPGNTVGYVVQQWHPFSPKFIVQNENREPVLKIHGPFCGWSCLPDVDFEDFMFFESNN